MTQLGRKIIKIAPELLTQMVTQNEIVGPAKCVQGLPPDAQYVRGWVDNSTPPNGVVVLMYEHPDWDIPDSGDEYEAIAVVMEKALK